MERPDLGSSLLQGGLLLTGLLVARLLALRWAVLEDLPRPYRKRIERWDSFAPALLTASIVVALVGLVLVLTG